MKTTRVILVACAVAACLTAAPALGQNVLANPGFESGAMAPWYQDSGGGPEAWNVTKNQAHTGLYSATTVGNNRIRQDFAPIPTADIKEVSFWLLQPDTSSGYAGWFRYSDNSQEQVGTNFPPNGVPTWTKVDMTSFLDPGKSLVSFGVWGYQGGGPLEDRTYIDDVIVYPEPSAALLLGLLGLMLRRR